MARWRFWSDTNQRGFEAQLARKGIAYRTDGYDVLAEGPALDELASDFGATRMREDATEKNGLFKAQGARPAGDRTVGAGAHAGADARGVQKGGLRAACRRHAPPEHGGRRPDGQSRSVQRLKARKADR